MGGGRRLSRGGRSTSVVNRRTLLGRLETYEKQHGFISLDDMVNHLRSNFRDYRCLKEKPFARVVQDTLNLLATRTNHNETKDNNDETPSKRHLLGSDDNDDDDDDVQSQRNKPEHEQGAAYRSRKRSKMEDHIKLSSVIDPPTSLFSSSHNSTPNKNLELEIAGQKTPLKIDTVNITTNESHRDEKGLGTTVGLEKSESNGGPVDGAEGAWFKDFGGVKEVLEELTDRVIDPIRYAPFLKFMGGKRPMTGILLHGPPGCGKTRLAHAIANEANVPFYQVAAPELVTGVSGASEENIRELFSKASRTAPSIIFIDEIDAIASNRENVQKGMEKRIVTQLMTCMDCAHGYVFIIGATNKPNDVDPALRRPGRFDKEICLPVPDENARVGILSVLTRDLRLESTFDLRETARSTPGFVGADLFGLVNEARMLAFKRIKSEILSSTVGEEDAAKYLRQPWLLEDTYKLNITMADFEKAIKLVQPSLKRDGFSAVPSVKWEDVGGLEGLRKMFEFDLVEAIKDPEVYKKFGVSPQNGYLLFGPPGCGKTLIAKALANEAGVNFIYIKGPELLNKYVGESEQAVRTLFRRARACSPCIIFFDEVDALASKRGNEGGWVIERLLNQLLVELDGEEDRRDVVAIGATNRPDVIDDALLRHGRFGECHYVPPPSPKERGLILESLARKYPIDADVDLIEIGKMSACDNFSGADLAQLMLHAAKAAIRECKTVDMTLQTIKAIHFEKALGGISPSLSEEQLEKYSTWMMRKSKVA